MFHTSAPRDSVAAAATAGWGLATARAKRAGRADRRAPANALGAPTLADGAAGEARAETKEADTVHTDAMAKLIE